MLTLRFIVLVLLPFFACSPETCNTAITQGTFYNVTKVVDGDTFWIDNGTEEGEKIRMIGIDAPESRKTGRKEIGYFGKESKEFLSSLIAGKRVRLKYDAGRSDQYRRTLAYIYLEDGTFVNAEMIKGGYAVVMTIAPNVKFAEWFVELQEKAREGKRGLWSNGN